MVPKKNLKEKKQKTELRLGKPRTRKLSIFCFSLSCVFQHSDLLFLRLRMHHIPTPLSNP